MAKTSKKPSLDFGRETGVAPSRMRASGRDVSIVTAVVDGGTGVFDNGLLQGKAKFEQGIKFGPEVLRAVKGRRVLACWLCVSPREDGKQGWAGMTMAEMRVDDAQKEGYRDTGTWPQKLMDAARGRVEFFRMKPEEKKAILVLLQSQEDLWECAAPAFRETILGAAGDAAGAAAAGAETSGSYPAMNVGAGGGVPPRTLRAGGRYVTVAGAILDAGGAAWDNGALTGASAVEKGITFGPEPMRATKGRRVCAVWVSATKGPEGEDGYFGATVGDMRIDLEKREGFKDLAAHGMKLAESSLGRIELWRLKPEERKALATLLQAQSGLWESAWSNFRDAFE